MNIEDMSQDIAATAAKVSYINATLESISEIIQREQGVSRDHMETVVSIEGYSLPEGCSIDSFTSQPSTANLNPALESIASAISKGVAAVFKAIADAIKAIISAVSSIFGGSGSSKRSKLSKEASKLDSEVRASTKAAQAAGGAAANWRPTADKAIASDYDVMVARQTEMAKIHEAISDNFGSYADASILRQETYVDVLKDLRSNPSSATLDIVKQAVGNALSASDDPLKKMASVLTGYTRSSYVESPAQVFKEFRESVSRMSTPTVGYSIELFDMFKNDSVKLRKIARSADDLLLRTHMDRYSKVADATKGKTIHLTRDEIAKSGASSELMSDVQKLGRLVHRDFLVVAHLGLINATYVETAIGLPTKLRKIVDSMNNTGRY